MVALIFILVVGIMITAALSKTGAVLKSDYLVRSQTQVQYAADAGIERALQVLRDDVSTDPAHFCPQATAAGAPDTDMTKSSDPSSQDPGGLSFNSNLSDSNNPHAGLKVHYSCHTLAGGVPDNNQFDNFGFSIVTTGGQKAGGVDRTLSTSNGAGKDLTVDGSVYIAGKAATADFNKNITVSNGDFIEFDQGNLQGCLTNLKSLAPANGSGPIIVPTSAQHSATCGSETPLDAIPTPNLPAAPAAAPPSVNFPLIGTATCRVFFPGTYTSAPNLLTPHGGGTPEANYFVSGRYNFDGIGNWTIDNGAYVFGGEPDTAAGDQSAVPGGSVKSIGDTGCAGVAGVTSATIKALLGLSSAPAGEWASGTQFIMGGTSTLTFKNGFLSLYTPPTAEGPASLMAVRTAQWTPTGTTDVGNGYTAWNGSQALTSFSGSGNNVGFIANGQILAPDAPVSLSGTNATIAAARYGIVGKTVDVNATAAISGGSFFFQPFGGINGKGTPPERRTVKVISCVDPNPGIDCLTAPTPSTLTETALATIENFGTRHIGVFSWRVN